MSTREAAMPTTIASIPIERFPKASARRCRQDPETVRIITLGFSKGMVSRGSFNCDTNAATSQTYG